MVAKDSDTMKVLSTKLAPQVVNGVRVRDASGKTVWDRVSYYRTVKLSTPLKGATGTLTPYWAATTSMLTLYAPPAAK
mgnify:CR=1 FL=1